jgi:hypothetical protein
VIPVVTETADLSPTNYIRAYHVMHLLSEGLEICFAHLLRLMHAPVRLDVGCVLCVHVYVYVRKQISVCDIIRLPFMSSTLLCILCCNRLLIGLASFGAHISLGVDWIII